MSVEDMVRRLNKLSRKLEILAEEILEISGDLGEQMDKAFLPPIVLFRVSTTVELDDGK